MTDLAAMLGSSCWTRIFSFLEPEPRRVSGVWPVARTYPDLILDRFAGHADGPAVPPTAVAVPGTSDVI